MKKRSYEHENVQNRLQKIHVNVQKVNIESNCSWKIYFKKAYLNTFLTLFSKKFNPFLLSLQKFEKFHQCNNSQLKLKRFLIPDLKLANYEEKKI